MIDLPGLFKEKGIKLTKQRLELIKLLEDMPGPVTAEEVFFQVKRKHPDICLATIYRNLELFVKKKLVRQLHLSGLKRSYELIGKDHCHYLICLGCKKTVKLRECPVFKYQEKISEETDFEITEHHFSLYGYCPECKKHR